jgi:hypothetical protein
MICGRVTAGSGYPPPSRNGGVVPRDPAIVVTYPTAINRASGTSDSGSGLESVGEIVPAALL